MHTHTHMWFVFTRFCCSRHGYFEWEPGCVIHETDSEMPPSCWRETHKTELIGGWRWNSRDIEEGTQRFTQSAGSSQKSGFHMGDSWFHFGSLISLKVVSCRPSTGQKKIHATAMNWAWNVPTGWRLSAFPSSWCCIERIRNLKRGASGRQKYITRDRPLKVIARALVQCLAQLPVCHMLQPQPWTEIFHYVFSFIIDWNYEPK